MLIGCVVREFKVDSTTGLVKPSHGVSVFDNPESVSGKGFVPHELDPESVPRSLKIEQRGRDPKHFENMPREPTRVEQYKEDLSKITVKPNSCR